MEKKWEYNRLKLTSKPPKEVFELLNKMGDEGWEVIQYIENNTELGHKKCDSSYLIVSKRIKPPNYLK